MLRKIDASVDSMEDIYNSITDLLIEKGYNRAEAIAGLLAIVAVQTLGIIPDERQMHDYIKGASEFTALFFGIGLDEGKKEVVN